LFVIGLWLGLIFSWQHAPKGSQNNENASKKRPISAVFHFQRDFHDNLFVKLREKRHKLQLFSRNLATFFKKIPGGTKISNSYNSFFRFKLFGDST